LQYLSDGVLLRAIARGDANLVLRNILLRLSDIPDQWQPFLADLGRIFPGLNLEVKFKTETDEFIDVRTTDGIPLELVGTGVLQAAQILSYIHRFSPSLVVLDEPDSHLHPNNQRLLCSLLHEVAEERRTQILLTTHSRHVVDAIGGDTQFLWVRKGTVDAVSPDDEIGVLMDIGALDIKERATQPGTKAIVVTEDQNTRMLETLLESSGFVMSDTVALTYYGISTIKQLRPLVDMVRKNNAAVKIIVHRDRDYLKDAEVNDWKVAVRALGAEPFLPTNVDVEAHFLVPAYLEEVNPGTSEEEWRRLVNEALAACRDDSVEHYVNGRIDIARAAGAYASVNPGALALEAARAVDEDLVRWSHGKTVLKRLRADYQATCKRNLQTDRASAQLAHPDLVPIARTVFSSASVADVRI
jgi:AAA domain, putative AbiEii toxin, Type IV TA system